MGFSWFVLVVSVLGVRTGEGLEARDCLDPSECSTATCSMIKIYHIYKSIVNRFFRVFSNHLNTNRSKRFAQSTRTFSTPGTTDLNREPALLGCSGAGGGTYVPSPRSVAGGGYGSVPTTKPAGPEGGRLLAEKTIEGLRRLMPTDINNANG